MSLRCCVCVVEPWLELDDVASGTVGDAGVGIAGACSADGADDGYSNCGWYFTGSMSCALGDATNCVPHDRSSIRVAYRDINTHPGQFCLRTLPR